MRALGLAENFLGLEEEWSDFERSKVVILPVPYERTTSYGKGAGEGPQAILTASHFVEFYDEEGDDEPFRSCGGIATLEPLRVSEARGGEEAVALIQAQIKELLDAGKFVVTLGGEHTVAIGAAAAYSRLSPAPSILQLDAHSDLRPQYEGNPYSHASTMRRIWEFNPRIVQVGIRSQCAEEADFIRGHDLSTLHMFKMRQRSTWADEAIDRLTERVYITFDCDVLDPSIMPAVGTPEPGGMGWEETVAFLKRVAAERTVVGFDVNELAPVPHLHFPEFTAAKLIYKILGYCSRGRAPWRNARGSGRS